MIELIFVICMILVIIFFIGGCIVAIFCGSVFRLYQKYNSVNNLTYDINNTKMVETTIAKYKENLVTAHIDDSLLKFSDGTVIYVGKKISCYGVIIFYLNTKIRTQFKLPKHTAKSLMVLVNEMHEFAYNANWCKS